ncbi:MAG TPA: prepilin-type N-terminal cleavage/methylation domain-containing protein [Thiomonas arsenitoxydans]|nr:prepilin-type N-terminal cleavage/methylation domain-containing protein [Thiomonas arsenitoxydans]
MTISLSPQSPRRIRQSGLTLVELMVAMLLGLVVVGAVVSVLLSSRQSYTTNYALSQVQDNARIAFELMARDIRQAGSSPCGNSNVSDVLAGTGWYHWVNGAGLFGVDDATQLAPLPAAPAPTASLPAIVTRGVGQVSANLITAGAACATGAPMTVAPTDVGIGADDLVLACDGTQAYIYQAAAFNAGLPLTAVGTGAPGNTSNLGCASFSSTAYVAPYQAFAWYVGAAGAGAPAGTLSLYRAHYAGNALVSDEIIRGVTNMQLAYLTNGTNVVSATTVGTAWNTVTNVRLTLTLQTLTNPNNKTNSEPLVRTFDTTIRVR